MANTMPFYFDDISSIDSSSRRERRYSEEQLSKQETVIKSLTYAVQRLADTLETKEAELQMKDRTDVNLECKVLDLMIENAELKNQLIDLKEGAAFQDTLSSQQWKNHRTPVTSDDYSSFQRAATTQGHHNDKENGDNVANENSLGNSKAVQIDKTLARRSSGLTLSKLMSKKLPSLKAGLGGHSLFTNLGEGKRLQWGKSSGVFPKLVPRRIFTFNKSVPDNLSDLSSV